MICDKYKKLIDNYLDKELSMSEINELKQHCEVCEKCREEFDRTIQYKQITRNIKLYTPNIENKESLISDILEKIPDQGNKPETTNIIYLPSKIRLAISTIAASLILFFAIQQAMDIWQITQLENRFATNRYNINYTGIKTNILLKVINNKPDKIFTDWFMKYKSTLLKKIKHKKINNVKTFGSFQLSREFIF